MTPAGLRSLFRYHRLTTGVKLANPHRFRHTFASDMLRAGLSLPALMQLMGMHTFRPLCSTSRSHHWRSTSNTRVRWPNTSGRFQDCNHETLAPTSRPSARPGFLARGRVDCSFPGPGHGSWLPCSHTPLSELPGCPTSADQRPGSTASRSSHPGLALFAPRRNPSLVLAAYVNKLIRLRRIFEELAWLQQIPDLVHLLRREDTPRAEKCLPRAFTSLQDQLIQQELLARPRQQCHAVASPYRHAHRRVR